MKIFSLYSCGLLLLILLLGTMTTGHAATLEKGQFLIATDTMKENGFSKSVIYITQANDEGTYGLIINRPTELLTEELIPQANSHTAKDSVFFGGPMHARFLFILAQTKEGKGLHAVRDNIYFGAGPSVTSYLEKSGASRSNVRTYAGFSSWAPGQIQAEIDKGDWLVVPAATKNLFDTHPDNLWQRLYKLWSGNWI